MTIEKLGLDKMASFIKFIPMKLNRKNCLLITLLLGLGLIFACSRDSKPSGPPIFYQGRISVSNQSDVNIVIVDMVQRRGTQQVQRQMGNGLGIGYSLFLHNIIDPDSGLIFPGGDRVTVHFSSELRDPNNPSQPLFQNSVQMTVNGSFTLQVKSGGSFNISPG